jgi:hypothetical protein
VPPSTARHKCLRQLVAAHAWGAALLLVSARATAADVTAVDGKEVQLDVTETTIVAQHFDPRTPPGQAAPGPATIEDSGWGEWLNRLNATLRWGDFSAGLRLDSGLYWRRPADNGSYASAYPQYYGKIVNGVPVGEVIQQDNESRFQNSIYPAKLWMTYRASGLEVTAGDSYVQFGRGLTLSMRKNDELGIDTTLRGAKVQFTKDPFAVTAIAGFANPARVDEATGRSLFVTSNLVPGDREQPEFGSDRVVGVDLQAGRGLPVTLSTHVVQFTRCAPYHYEANGIDTDLARDPGTVMFGTCNAADTATWLGSLNDVPRGLKANQITMVGQTLEVPSLGGHGKLYLEAAGQERQSDQPGQTTNLSGNALYATLAFDVGITNTTFELKSNRNFYTVAASVGQAAPELAIVAYSFLPPAESFNMLDAEGTGDFNACVEGGRLREDVNVTKRLLVYAQGVFAYSQTEQPSGACDQYGHTLAPMGVANASVEDVIYDGVGGFEYTFDKSLSHVYGSAGARDDTREDSVFQYREQHLEYSVAKYLGGPWSIEVQGRDRHREEQGFNQDASAHPQWWYEGDNYVALRMAPKWVFTQGFEYTTMVGQPRLYFNGAVLYKFTSGSNVRVFVGEQRGAFHCASGICRFFPAFEGARAELTLRF